MPWELTGNSGTNPTTNFLGTTDGQPLVIKTSGSERMHITSDGKVGIGFQNPDATLHVFSITTNYPQVQPGLHIEGKGYLTSAVLRFTDGGTPGFHDPIHQIDIPPRPGIPWDIIEDGGSLRFALPQAENWVVGTIMALFADGNVGIGSVKPNARLHISSDGKWDHPQLHIEQTALDSYARIRFNKANKDTGEQVGTYWDIAVGGSTGAEVMNFYTQDMNVMTLTHDGNVGIGSSSPDAKLLITSGGGYNSPQVHIFQTTLGDFARLRLNGMGPGDPDTPGSTVPWLPWDIAVATNIMNFYSEGTGNIMTLKAIAPRGRVGIGTEDPQAELHVEGDVRVAGDIVLTSADCAEEFDIEESTEVEPGTVMVLDQDGMLRPSESAYDKRVAGVISGAGDFKPGIILDKQQLQSNRKPIALVGKVYCKVDARYAPIEIGDLLTTSLTGGHAMKAEDPVKAFGSVIGKALRPLKVGQGLIPILIALQ